MSRFTVVIERLAAAERAAQGQVDRAAESETEKPCPPVPLVSLVPIASENRPKDAKDPIGTAPHVFGGGAKQTYHGPFAAELAALLAANPTQDKQRWRQACDDAERFLEQWGAEAERLGWTAQDLFGLHPEAPLARYDAMGLVWLLRGRAIVELGGRQAKVSGGLVVTRSNASKTYLALLASSSGMTPLTEMRLP